MTIQTYQRPENLSEALKSLYQPNATPILLGPRVPAELFQGAQIAVDLRDLKLVYIREEAQSIHVGAHTPLQEIAQSPLLNKLAGGILSEAANLAAHLGLRHIAVIGGALSSPDIENALLVLNATVVTHGKEKREIPLQKYQPVEGEILAEIKFPVPPAWGALSRVARTPRDSALVSAAAVADVNTGVLQDVRLAVGPRGQRMTGAEHLAEGHAPTPEILQAVAQAVENTVQLDSDFRASDEYRRKMAGVLAARALKSLFAYTISTP